MKSSTYIIEAKGRKYLPVAKITRPHGLKGDLKVLAYNPDSPVFNGEITNLYITGSRKEDIEEYTISTIGRAGKFITVHLDGIEDRNAAETMRNREIMIDYNQLPPAADDEYYLYKLIGLKVLDEKGNAIGAVHDISMLPHHPILTIIKEDKTELLLPLVDEIIKEVQIDEGYITVDMSLEES